MNYKLVTYFPENDNSDIKLLMNRIVENSVSKIYTEAALEWRCANENRDGFEIYGISVDDAQCICRKSIMNTFYIDNDKTKTSLILGSCCIKKFLPDALRCKKCDEPLNNIVKRLLEKNYTCPTCTRLLNKIAKEREKMYAEKAFYWRNHKYNGKLFKDIVHDEDFINDLYVNGMPFNSRSMDYLLDYAKNYYDFLPLFVQEKEEQA